MQKNRFCSKAIQKCHLPAGLTCLKEVAAGAPHAVFSSLTSCQPLSASQRLMKPGEPFTTEEKKKTKSQISRTSPGVYMSAVQVF